MKGPATIAPEQKQSNGFALASRKMRIAPSLLAADDRAALAAARSCIAYAGRYEVWGDQVHHHVENSLLPDWVGRTLVRTIRWQGDVLTLSPPDEQTRSGKTVQRAITWTRTAAEKQ